MYLARGFAVWLVIIFAESVHGVLRQMFLAPLVGDFTARRIAFFVGIVLIFLIASLCVRWIDARTTGALLAVGAMWAALTTLFEFALGRFVLEYSGQRMLEDYDIRRGGLMAFGLLFMCFAPLLAARARGIESEAARSF